MKLGQIVRRQFLILFIQFGSIDGRIEELKKIEQLSLVVLKGGASDQQSTGRLKVVQFIVECRIFVLQPVSLVNSKELPSDLLQECIVVENIFVRGDHAVKLDLFRVPIDE